MVIEKIYDMNFYLFKGSIYGVFAAVYGSINIFYIAWIYSLVKDTPKKVNAMQHAKVSMLYRAKVR